MNAPSIVLPVSPASAGSLEGGILITIHRLSHGGADRVAIHLANGFARAGIPVGFAILRGGGEGDGALRALLHDDVHCWVAGAPMRSRHLELVRGLSFIRRLVASARPALVLASSNNMGLVTGLSSRMRHDGHRPAYVLKTTNPVLRPCDRSALRKAYRRRLYRFVFSHFDRILNLTEDEQVTLSRMCADQKLKFEVVQNPYVSPDMLVDEPRQPRGRKHILALARMMPQKRLDVLLASFARVGDPACRLTILGDGPERARLQSIAKDLGIEERVDMPGFVECVVPALRASDLFVLSSDYEGLPGALFEAFACEVPVVTTDSFEGARRLLADAPACGVVPVGDIDALARAIEDSLASTTDLTGLRQLARRYDIQAGIESHLRAVEPLLRAEGKDRRA